MYKVLVLDRVLYWLDNVIKRESPQHITARMQLGIQYNTYNSTIKITCKGVLRWVLRKGKLF